MVLMDVKGDGTKTRSVKYFNYPNEPGCYLTVTLNCSLRETT